MDILEQTFYQTPYGTLRIATSSGRLCICDWDGSMANMITSRKVCKALGSNFKNAISTVASLTMSQLDEYFAGRRTNFEIPLYPIGTPFQQNVWTELLKIPYGQTISYAEEAQRIENPKAVRAVASANRLNPIAIIIPCHRVIGSNKSLTGYAGGLAAKKFLLELEQDSLK